MPAVSIRISYGNDVTTHDPTVTKTNLVRVHLVRSTPINNISTPACCRRVSGAACDSHQHWCGDQVRWWMACRYSKDECHSVLPRWYYFLPVSKVVYGQIRRRSLLRVPVNRSTLEHDTSQDQDLRFSSCVCDRQTCHLVLILKFSFGDTFLFTVNFASKSWAHPASSGNCTIPVHAER